MQRRRDRNFGFGGLMLLHEISKFGLKHIPPVTLGCMGINVALYYMYFGYMETDVCIGAPSVWYDGDLKRLLFGSFFHWDEFHLSYNMISLLWKGRLLERRIGTTRFVWFVIVMAAMSGGLSVLVAIGAARYLNYPRFLHECAVGFSDVLFAMKVLLTATEPGNSSVPLLPFVVPNKYAAWAELLVIQLLVPRASFLGHLCGILAGTIYMTAVYHRARHTFPLSLLHRFFTFPDMFDSLLPVEFQHHHYQQHDDPPPRYPYYAQRGRDNVHIRDGVLRRGY